MNIDDKKYTWGYIIVLAVIIILCLIGGLFGEANAEECQHQFNNLHICNLCGHECTHPDSYLKGKHDWMESNDGKTAVREIACSCGFYGYQTHVHVYNTYTTFVYCDKSGNNCVYRDKTKCNCGKEGPINSRPIPESDWSSWTYFATINENIDEYQRSVSAGGSTIWQYKNVAHKHVATTETANKTYAWHAAGDGCQYSVTRECDRCHCHYEDIKTIKNHEYKFDRVEDGHDVLVCVSCGDVINREHVHTWTESDVEESDRQYLHSSNMCYLEKHYEKCVCGAKHQIGAVEYKHEMQCVGHVDSTATKHGYNEYCCANCDYSYRVKLPLISEYMYEKYYDEETGISYFESNVTSEYYYRALTEDGYIYAASFEELFITIFGEEYDPLYFEEYYPHALTIETGIYVCPEV